MEHPKDTRQRLIAAGRRLMAARGFDGASIRVLTEEAGSNLGAVTYHFGSKEELYHAVLEEVVAPFRRQVQLLRDMPLPALAKVERLIRGMFRHLRENPDMPRFMVQELVLGDHPAPQILDTIKVVAQALIEFIGEGQVGGTIRKGDPVLLALSTLSQPIYLSIMPPVLANEELKKAGVPQPRLSPEDHAVDFVLRSLQAREEEEE